MNAISSSRETPEQRLDRQAAYFRDIAEANMATVRTAHAAIERSTQAGDDTHKHILDLARATRGVISAVAAENDLFRKQAPRRAPVSDTRRAPLCDALQKAAKSEPDPARRNALNRDIPVLVEETLLEDPDEKTPIHIHLFALADHLDLTLDPATLPDQLIGIPPRKLVRDG